jgi:hypothetical protein
MTLPLPSGPPGTRIWCCCCLNLDNTDAADATTIVSGYAVCDQHADLLTGEFSDFAALIRRLKTRGPGGPA